MRKALLILTALAGAALADEPQAKRLPDPHLFDEMPALQEIVRHALKAPQLDMARVHWSDDGTFRHVCGWALVHGLRGGGDFVPFYVNYAPELPSFSMGILGRNTSLDVVKNTCKTNGDILEPRG